MEKRWGMMKKMNIFTHTLGCKVNQYETQKLEHALFQKGYGLSPLSEADIFIINTCTVTQIADKKSRQMIRKAKKSNPNLKIVAMGCFVEQITETEKEALNIDLCISNREKDRGADILEAWFPTKQGFCPQNINYATNTRTHLKIQEGCNQFCTYCIIPYVRGRSFSMEKDKIVKEAMMLSETHREIVLTGIHISSYGKDLTPQSDLKGLMDALFQQCKRARFRLGSLEAGIISTSFLEALSNQEQFCPHFHLSLQSGSDSVLKQMNRRYTTAEYDKKVSLIRKYFKDAAITTDIIVGFPGETENLFQETLDFVQKIKFAMIHVFPYSKRAGTKAYDMPLQVDKKEKERRAQMLIEQGKQLHEAYLNGFLGKEEEVIFERRITQENTVYLEGHGKHYQKILGNPLKYNLNERYKVFINRQKNDILYVE